MRHQCDKLKIRVKVNYANKFVQNINELLIMKDDSDIDKALKDNNKLTDFIKSNYETLAIVAIDDKKKLNLVENSSLKHNVNNMVFKAKKITFFQIVLKNNRVDENMSITNIVLEFQATGQNK